MSQIEALRAHGRALAEELMVDAGVISRPSASAPVLNTTTGLLTPAAATTVHTGPCRVKAVGAQEQVAIFGDEAVSQQRFVISFPHDIPVVQLGDTVAVTSSDDAQMLTRQFRVVAVETKSVLHSRRLGVETVEDA